MLDESLYNARSSDDWMDGSRDGHISAIIVRFVDDKGNVEPYRIGPNRLRTNDEIVGIKQNNRPWIVPGSRLTYLKSTHEF